MHASWHVRTRDMTRLAPLDQRRGCMAGFPPLWIRHCIQGLQTFKDSPVLSHPVLLGHSYLRGCGVSLGGGEKGNCVGPWRRRGLDACYCAEMEAIRTGAYLSMTTGPWLSASFRQFADAFYDSRRRRRLRMLAAAAAVVVVVMKRGLPVAIMAPVTHGPFVNLSVNRVSAGRPGKAAHRGGFPATSICLIAAEFGCVPSSVLRVIPYGRTVYFIM